METFIRFFWGTRNLLFGLLFWYTKRLQRSYCNFQKHANSENQNLYKMNVFFATINHKKKKYNHKQWILAETEKGTKTDWDPPITNRWSKLLFSKVIDSTKNRKCQLAFELQNSHVFEKPSNFAFIKFCIWGPLYWRECLPGEVRFKPLGIQVDLAPTLLVERFRNWSLGIKPQ